MGIGARWTRVRSGVSRSRTRGADKAATRPARSCSRGWSLSLEAPVTCYLARYVAGGGRVIPTDLDFPAQTRVIGKKRSGDEEQ
jgi:hypothetical protein